MQYGIAVWNYREPGMALSNLVADFADLGCDATSLSLHFVGKLAAAECERLATIVSERNLTVTLHTNFELFRPEDLDLTVSLFGPRLYCLTFDAARKDTSLGQFYDLNRMIPVLLTVAERAPGVCFGVEDFPLDEAALTHYHEPLQPVLQLPRYGTLIDLGHLNLRLRYPYFSSLTPEQYLRQVPLPILEVHVHDNDGLRDLHQHLGEGNTDFASAAAGLQAVGFSGINTIEVSPAMHDEAMSVSRPRVPESLHRWRSLIEPA